MQFFSGLHAINKKLSTPDDFYECSSCDVIRRPSEAKAKGVKESTYAHAKKKAKTKEMRNHLCPLLGPSPLVSGINEISDEAMKSRRA